MQRLSYVILERKVTLLRNLLNYELTKDLINRISSLFNNSSEPDRKKFKDSWIHELVTEASTTEFSTDEIIKSLMARITKSYQEDSVLYQHDPEVGAIIQFLTYPSELNRQNLMNIIGTACMQMD